MGSSIDTELDRGLAGYYYSLINELEISLDQRRSARDAWTRLSVSPWSSLPIFHPDSTAYIRAFQESFGKSGPFKNLCLRWQSKFDPQGNPLPQVDIRRFITDAIYIQLHSPHVHHDFFCIFPTFKPNSVMDFSITHPIANDFWTICFTEAGAGYIQAKTHQIELLPGFVALIPPGFQGQVGRRKDSEEWRCCYLGFRSKPQWLKLLNWSFPLHTPVILKSNSMAERESIRQVLSELSTINYQRGDINESLCFNLIANLLIRFNRLNTKCFVNETGGNDLHILDSRISAAVNFVINHYDKSYSLEEIASKANLSSSRLSAVFKQHYGISLIQWRNSIRLSAAENLLAKTNLNIADISQQVGWADQLYFSKRFKKKYGHSPRSYRRRVQSELISVENSQ